MLRLNYSKKLMGERYKWLQETSIEIRGWGVETNSKISRKIGAAAK